jgi:peptidoglycan/LPS O-acetylase OafA/YrhL
MPLGYGIFLLIILLVFGLLLIQAWLPQTFSFWNNSASWSISAEAFFYSLFPGLRDPIANLSLKALILSFGALCMISTMIPVSAIVFRNTPDSFSLFYAMPIFRVPEFVAGMVTYSIMLRMRWSSKWRNALFVVLLLGILHVVFIGPRLPGFTP